MPSIQPTRIAIFRTRTEGYRIASLDTAPCAKTEYDEDAVSESALSAAGFIARLPLSMTGVGIMLSQQGSVMVSDDAGAAAAVRRAVNSRRAVLRVGHRLLQLPTGRLAE